MLQALRYLKDWDITLYSTSENNYYDAFGYSVCRVNAHRRDWPGLMIRDLLNIHGLDPFAREDLILAPFHSPILLHTRKPFAYTLHDLQEHYFPENFSWLRRSWRRLMNSCLTKRASRIVCESDHVRRDIIFLLGAAAEKVVVIPAPPVTMRSSDCSPEFMDATRAKYQLPDQYLLYPAQFWPHKNHMRLVEAFSRISSKFPKLQLVLTGSKRDEYQKVFARVRELRLEQRVRHIGYVEQSELGVLYRCAQCLVMPSLFESISIPVYEAFQCGTPVCASNVVAIPEQVGNAGLLFDPYSAESIAESICSLLGSDDLRSHLARLGRARLEAMSHELYSKQLESLLESLSK